MKVKLTENKIRDIVRETLKNVLGENNTYNDYYRRYNKLKGVAKNQDSLDKQKKELTNNVYTAMSDYQVPNYDGGFNATNKLQQHNFKQHSVNTFNNSNQQFEYFKNYYNPQNFKVKCPQPYITVYNNWLKIKPQYLKLYQIYTNEYCRASGRMTTTSTNRGIKEYDKLNNFYKTKVEPMFEEVKKCEQFLNYWSQYFYKLNKQ